MSDVNKQIIWKEKHPTILKSFLVRRLDLVEMMLTNQVFFLQRLTSFLLFFSGSFQFRTNRYLWKRIITFSPSPIDTARSRTQTLSLRRDFFQHVFSCKIFFLFSISFMKFREQAARRSNKTLIATLRAKTCRRISPGSTNSKEKEVFWN